MKSLAGAEETMETLVLTNVHPFLSSFPNNLKRKAIFICIKMFNNSDSQFQQSVVLHFYLSLLT